MDPLRDWWTNQDQHDPVREWWSPSIDAKQEEEEDDPLRKWWSREAPRPETAASPPYAPGPPGMGRAIQATGRGLGRWWERIKELPEQLSEFAGAAIPPGDPRFAPAGKPREMILEQFASPERQEAAMAGLEAASTMTGPFSIAAGDIAREAGAPSWLAFAVEMAAAIPEGMAFGKIAKGLAGAGKAAAGRQIGAKAAGALPEPEAVIRPFQKAPTLTVEQQARIARDPALKKRLMDTADAMFDAGGEPEDILAAQKRLIDEIMPPRPEKVVGEGFDAGAREAFLAQKLQSGQFTPKQAAALFRDRRFARNILRSMIKEGNEPEGLRKVFGDLVDDLDGPTKIDNFAEELQKSVDNISEGKPIVEEFKGTIPEGGVIAAHAPAAPAARDSFASMVEASRMGTVFKKAGDWLTMLREFRAVAAISGLSTQFLNVSSEALNLIGRVAFTEAAALADLPLAAGRRLLRRGGREVYFTEGLSELFGLFKGLDEAMFDLGNASREAAREYLRQPVKYARDIFRTPGTIPGRAGEIIRSPFGLLGYMDTFLYNREFQAQMFKMLTRQGLKGGRKLKEIPEFVSSKLAALDNELKRIQWAVDIAKETGDKKAMREANKALKDLFDDPLIAGAKKYAAEATFQEPLISKLDKAVESLSRVPVVSDIALFIQTPYRVAKEVARQTPLALGKVQYSNILDPQNAEYLGRGLLGAGLMAYGAYNYYTGRIQPEIPGFSPEAATKRAAQMGTTGSVKVGDRLVPLENFGPIGLVIGAGALAAKMVEQAKERGMDTGVVTKLRAMIESIAYTMITQTPAQNLSEAFNALAHPEITEGDAWSRIGAQVGRSFVPNIIQRTARALGEQPEVAELAPGPSIVGGALAAVPGVQMAPPSTDVFGHPVRIEHRDIMDQIGNYLLSRGLGKAEASDPVLRELIRLKVWKRKPSGRIEILGEPRKLSPKEEYELQNARGLAQYDVLRQVIKDPEYLSLPDSDREKVLRRFIRTGSDIGSIPYREKYQFREAIR